MLDKRDVYRLYRKAPLRTKLYLRIKLCICPFLKLETFFPRSGRVVDLGCGNGVFSNLLKLGSPDRDIIGFDLDPQKIETARVVHGDRPGLEFRSGDIAEVDYPEADVISLIDVLYLIPFDRQEAILRKSRDSLRPGGLLIIKEMDRRPRRKYLWNLFQETLAVKVIGFTLGGRFFFRPVEDFVRLLSSMGFAVEAVRLDRGQWHPHVVIIGRRVAA